MKSVQHRAWPHSLSPTPASVRVTPSCNELSFVHCIPTTNRIRISQLVDRLIIRMARLCAYLHHTIAGPTTKHTLFNFGYRSRCLAKWVFIVCKQRSFESAKSVSDKCAKTFAVSIHKWRTMRTKL